MSDRFSESVARFVAKVEAAVKFPNAKNCRLIRPRYPRVIAGVCSGIAEAYGWDATLLRILFVVLAVGTSGVVAAGYIVAWVLIPEGSYALSDRSRTSVS